MAGWLPAGGVGMCWIPVFTGMTGTDRVDLIDGMDGVDAGE